MMKIHRILCLLLSLSFVFGAFVFSTGAEEPIHTSPSLSAQSAVLMEGESGAVICEKNAHTRLPMASTTKIMTALVALELAAPDTVILVDERAVGTEGSSIYLCAGEKLTLEELLYALMLESANDAAVAIAIGISGSEEAFVDEMNRKASSLGLSDTHFANPHGLDAEAHYTTAYELAKIARVALQNPLLKTIVSTRKTTIPHQETDNVRLLVNHNKMLRLYDGCIGVKTGYTQKSGRCLVSAAERDGVMMIAVTIDSPDDWNDHTKLLDFGFSLFRSVELCPADFRFCLPVVGGKETYVLLGVAQQVTVTLPLGAGVIEQKMECPRHLFAPVKEGDVCGCMLFLCDTNNDGIKETIKEIPLIAQYSISKYSPRLSLWQRILLWWQGLFS
jgi:D-alanyl-D-alanine carboxypeptidase/D-alanyl-D-alanine carboxypeptidase (penicillin-binding protein 5/6)